MDTVKRPTTAAAVRCLAGFHALYDPLIQAAARANPEWRRKARAQYKQAQDLAMVRAGFAEKSQAVV